MTGLAVGTVVPVVVGGVTYDTVIDESGVQRFIENPAVTALALGGTWLPEQFAELMLTNGAVAIAVGTRVCGGNVLNDLALAYELGAIIPGTGKPLPQRDHAEFMMMLGYSVSGFQDLHHFADMKIENPLWNDLTHLALAGS
jgi:hypothetical protein